MPTLVNIEGVGAVTFPDGMSESDISAAAGKLHSEAQAPQGAPTLTLPTELANPALPTQPEPTSAPIGAIPIPSSWNDPSALLPQPGAASQTAAPNGMLSTDFRANPLAVQAKRNEQAAMSGMTALPSQALTAFRQAGDQSLVPLNAQLQQSGVPPVSSLADDALARMPQPLADSLTFQPKDASETAIQLGMGFLAPEAAVLNSAAKQKLAQEVGPISKIPVQIIAGHVDDATIGPALKESVVQLVLDQAVLEKHAVAQALPIGEITTSINNRKGAISAGMKRIDDLAQEAAVMSAQKEQNLALWHDPLFVDSTIRTEKEITREARTVLNTLAKERNGLTKELKVRQTLKLDITDTADKLRTNMLAQVNVQEAITGAKIPVVNKVDITRTFGSQSTPELIHEMAMQRVKDLDGLVEQGLISKENAGAMRQAVYGETLKANGIKTETEKLSKYNILGELFRWGQVQKKTGIPSGEAVQNIVTLKTRAGNYQNENLNTVYQITKAAKKAGLDPDTLLSDLQYFRTQADGSIAYDASAIAIPGKVNVPQTLKQFTPEQQSVLVAARKQLDMFASDLELPKLPGYIPTRMLPELDKIPTGTSAERLLNPSIAIARTAGSPLTPGLHDTDYVSVMSRYISEAGKRKYTGPALENGIDVLNQLQLSRLPNESQAFKKYLLDVFNINGEQEAAQIFGTYKLGQIKPELEAFVRLLPEPAGALRQINDAVTRAIYTNLVGTHATAWVKQWIQAPMMGSIELGPQWMASGVKTALTSSERRKAAQQLLKYSLQEATGPIEENLALRPTNAVAKALDFINKPASIVAEHTMGTGEKANRIETILAAQNKFDHFWLAGREASVDKLLKESALTTAQRSTVSKAFLEGSKESVDAGVKAARDAYALLVTQRVNFTYSMADKPELLRSTFGSLFPFTTYARNILSRAAEASVEGKPGYIAKMVAYPLAGLALFAGITGRQLPSGSMPVEAITDLVTHGITPSALIAAQNPVQALTPIPAGFVRPSLDKPIDTEKGMKSLEKKLTPFKEGNDKSNPLYKGIIDASKGLTSMNNPLGSSSAFAAEPSNPQMMTRQDWIQQGGIPVEGPAALTVDNVKSVINKHYATDPNYIKRIQEYDSWARSPEAAKNEGYLAAKKEVDDMVDLTDMQKRVLIAQASHETNKFKSTPGNNPGGIKLSNATKDFLKGQDQDTRKMISQVMSTRENVPLTMDGIKDMFADRRSEFKANKVASDILTTSSKTTSNLNALVKKAQNATATLKALSPDATAGNIALLTDNEKASWNNLAKSVVALKSGNKSLWVSQPFMKYSDIGDGLRDMRRAQIGGKDPSEWDNTNGNISRKIANNIIGTYNRQ